MRSKGNGFFVVSTPDGDRYTRDGSFSVTDAGYLVNNEGLYVQGQNGRIYVGGDDFTVDEQGNIYVNDMLTNKFRIVEFQESAEPRETGR